MKKEKYYPVPQRRLYPSYDPILSVTCCAVLLLGFSFFSFTSLVVVVVAVCWYVTPSAAGM